MAVYFVQAGKSGPVKIGFAKNIARRISKIRVDCPEPVRLLGALPEGTEADEHALHRQFASDHLRGEWFRYSEAIAAFVAPLPTIALWEQTKGRVPPPRFCHRERPADRDWTIDVIGEYRRPPLRRACVPQMPGTGERGHARDFLKMPDAEFAEAALVRFRAEDPDDWPAWWFDWLRERGTPDERIRRFYRLHLPVRPLGIDLLGGKTGVDEPIWKSAHPWAAIWPPARPFVTV